MMCVSSYNFLHIFLVKHGLSLLSRAGDLRLRDNPALYWAAESGNRCAGLRVVPRRGRVRAPREAPAPVRCRGMEYLMSFFLFCS